MYTDELFEVYLRYELAVHKKERVKANLTRFLCNSPLYDPEKEPHKAHSPMFFKQSNIDKYMNTFQDEGIYPEAMGTYHMYHRIDGKLVAIGVLDICKRFMNSAYLIYDPDYKFLNLGVVSAIREIEYMNMIRKNFNPDLTFYQLGEMVPCCPKVNYKLNYQPGIVICPRTKVDLYWKDVEETTKVYESLPMAEKASLPYLQLDDASDEPLPVEMMVNMVAPQIGDALPVLYGPNGRFIKMAQLSEKGREILEPFAIQLLGHAGLDFFNNCVFELKWKPKTDDTSSDEEPAKKPERPTPEEVTTLRSIVIDFSLTERQWFVKLFIENRAIFFKCMETQTKIKPEDIKAKL